MTDTINYSFESDEEYYISDEKKHYYDNYELGSILGELIQNHNESDFHLLFIKLARLNTSEFLNTDLKVQVQINQQLAILSSYISSGGLDKWFFYSDVINNKELIKYLIAFLERLILKTTDRELEEIHEYTVNNFKILILELIKFVPDIKPSFKLSTSEIDKIKSSINIDIRKSLKAPTNKEKIKALKVLAPELWERLQNSQSKEIQQKAIFTITGTNLEDSYKYSFGSRQKELNRIDMSELEKLIKE